MLNRVIGFYASWGSTDLPFNFDTDKPFGFADSSSTVPVFAYSLNNVYNAFVAPRTIKCVVNNRNLEGLQPRVGELIVESENNSDVSNINVSDTDWQNVFKAFDFITMNQAASELSSHVDKEAFNSWIDEQLGSYNINGEANVNYVSNYKHGSFLDTRWSVRTRIESFSIVFMIDNNLVDFLIYLVPDEFVTTNVLNNGKFSVWTMIEKVDDGVITSSELESQALDKIEDIMIKGQYLSRIKFTTAWKKRKSDGTYNDTVSRWFYIYTNIAESNLTQVTPTQQKSLVQNYILTESELGINGDRSEAARQYPDLFSDQGMIIVPVYGNVITTNEEGSIRTVHPLSFEKIEEVKTRFYNTNLLVGEPKAEWFYLPTSENGSPSAYHIFPILAIEDTNGDNYTYPITSRFPDYDLTPYNSVTGSASSKTINFQFSLAKILTYLKGDADEASIQAIAYISSIEIIDKTYTDPKMVKFVYEGTLYTVYGVWEDVV